MEGMMGLRRSNGSTACVTISSYRIVLARLIEQSRPTEAADIAWRLVFFWLIRWHTAEGSVVRADSHSAELVPARSQSTRWGRRDVVYAQAEIPRARTSPHPCPAACS
jgi:hypothetical protein